MYPEEADPVVVDRRAEERRWSFWVALDADGFLAVVRSGSFTTLTAVKRRSRRSDMQREVEPGWSTILLENKCPWGVRQSTESVAEPWTQGT